MGGMQTGFSIQLGGEHSDLSGMAGLSDAFKEYGQGYGLIVDRVLRSPKATSLLYRSINPLMPVSGVTWPNATRYRKRKPAKTRHTAGAKASEWPEFSWGDLSVTIKPKKKYSYLYYPDDGRGSNHHVGMQQFFKRGGDAAAPEIAQQIASALKDEISLRAR